MTLEDDLRLRFAGLPDRDARVRAAGGDTSIREKRNGINSAAVEAQDLQSSVALQRPEDCGGIETAGYRRRAVGRNSECPHWTAVTSQLAVRRMQATQTHRSHDNQLTEQDLHALQPFGCPFAVDVQPVRQELIIRNQ